ncbi:MAG: type II toxin-antitoxin system HipA family toxin [Kofleriaceae bacterium]
MPSDLLDVHSGSLHVATLDVSDLSRLVLTYEPTWLGSERAFPISISLPLRAEPFVGAAAQQFFANLLPEGQARQAVCGRLGISIDNDIALLRAIGGECAGALSVVERGPRRRSTRDEAYEPLTDARLAKLIGDDAVVPLLIGGPPTRLSLAGAQDKLPVALFDGELYLPLEGAPSTHILKLPNPRYRHLPLNEAYVMGLAAQLGFDVAGVDVVTKTDPPSLLVERYDRRVGADQDVERLHQEDLCQALGLPPGQRYEQEGGPSFARAVVVVRDHVQQPVVDVRRLLEWLAFNVVVGNSDGHAKNLALLYDGPTARLAPFYDLLSTRQYPALDHQLAMSIAGRRDAATLHRPHWEQLARDAGLGPRIATDTVTRVAERCLEAQSAWIKDYRHRYGNRAVLQRLPTWITRSARRVLANLRR